MSWPVAFSWESLPEYRCTQRYGYSMGRVVSSIPPVLQQRCGDFLSRMAVMMAKGIALANLEVPSGDPAVPDTERLEALGAALEAIGVSRELMKDLRGLPGVSEADILVSLDLLERVESGVQGQVESLKADVAQRERLKLKA